MGHPICKLHLLCTFHICSNNYKLLIFEPLFYSFHSFSLFGYGMVWVFSNLTHLSGWISQTNLPETYTQKLKFEKCKTCTFFQISQEKLILLGQLWTLIWPIWKEFFLPGQQIFKSSWKELSFDVCPDPRWGGVHISP